MLCTCNAWLVNITLWKPVSCVNSHIYECFYTSDLKGSPGASASTCSNWDVCLFVCLSIISSHLYHVYISSMSWYSVQVVKSQCQRSTVIRKRFCQWANFFQRFFLMILKFSMGHFLAFYTDFNAPLSKLMGLWHIGCSSVIEYSRNLIWPRSIFLY